MQLLVEPDVLGEIAFLLDSFYTEYGVWANTLYLTDREIEFLGRRAEKELTDGWINPIDSPHFGYRYTRESFKAFLTRTEKQLTLYGCKVIPNEILRAEYRCPLNLLIISSTTTLV